jgi:hypothetical protein
MAPRGKEIFSEMFAQYWQIAQCMPERNQHTLRAAWRLLVEDWLRRQQWITIRDNQQQKVSTNWNSFFSQNVFCTTEAQVIATVGHSLNPSSIC